MPGPLQLSVRTAMFFIVVILGAICCGSESVQTDKPLVVGTKEVPPFVIQDPDGKLSGISIELWEYVAAQLNMECEYRTLSLEGLLGGLEDGSLDAAVGALTVTSSREAVFDFTHSFHTSGLGIAVMQGKRNSWLALAERFVSTAFLKVLLILMLVLFLAGTLVWLFERRVNHEQFGGKVPNGLGAAFWWSAVTMTTVGYGDKAPQTLGGRLVALIWMFTGIVVISSFTAAIASSLTVTQLENKVKGPGDLPRVRVATVQASTSEDYLRRNRIAYRTYGTPQEALNAIASDEVDALVYDAVVMKYLVNREMQGKIQILPQTFERQYYAIGLPEGSDLREAINRFLLEKINSAEWKDVIYTYLGE